MERLRCRPRLEVVGGGERRGVFDSSYESLDHVDVLLIDRIHRLQSRSSCFWGFGLSLGSIRGLGM
jgi:hypothetical protein